MKIEIKHWITGSILFEGDFSCIAEAVKAAIKASANLSSVYKALPNLENPDKEILARIEAGSGALEMGGWHQCETTHCRAGWYIHQSGPAGYMLEACYGPSVAGALIFSKAYPGRKVPNFHASNEDALADIKANAAKSV